MDELREAAARIVYCLRTGEVSHAYSLYPAFLNQLITELDEQHLVAISPLLSEMLAAQEQNNTVWLADLLQFVLLEHFPA